MEIIQSKKLKVELIKVKAHNSDFFNEQADTLAKEALNFPAIEINCQETGPILALSSWNNTPIRIPIKDFIKELNKKTINFQWANQKRNTNLFSQEIQNEEHYEWSFLWGKQKKNRHFTTIQDSKKKAFWIKIAQDELPTLDKLAIRKPKLYEEHQICSLCLVEKETRTHLFNCPSTHEELEGIWSKAEEKLLNIENNEETLETIEKGKQLISKIKRRLSNSPQDYIKAFTGLIKKEDIKELKESAKISENRCKNLIFNFFNLLRKQFHEDIWNLRCREIIAMEKTLGITTKNKKIKVLKDSNQRTRKKRIPKKTTTIQQNNEERLLTNTSISPIKDKIKNWIQYGKND